MGKARFKIGNGEWQNIISLDVDSEPIESEYRECTGCMGKATKPRIITSEPVEATFVWIYWNGGAKADELRWSIRSVLANYHGKANILVIGDAPAWYNGPLIKVDRIGPCDMRRYRDQLNKFYIACHSELVPDNFVWMMDDTYFIDKVTFEDLNTPFYHGQIPQKVSGETEWSKHKRVSLDAVRSRGLPEVDYTTHMPHVLNKEKFLYTWNHFELDKNPISWEIAYGADHWQDNRQYLNRRLFSRITRAVNQLPNTPIANNSEKGWSESLRKLLASKFPNPSEVEMIKLKPMREEKRMSAGLLEFINALPDGPLTMAEIGSYAGESAAIFAASGKFSEIHCVDCWNTTAGKAFRTSDAEPYFDKVAAQYPSLISKYKATSVDGSWMFEEASLDLVYIDAAHNYANVKADIAAWKSKVKAGGWVGGHDYCLNFTGVIQAVTEAFNQPVTIFQDSSWLVKV